MSRYEKNVQPLRTREEIEEMKWALRKFCSERDYFLFLFGINTGLRVSDIVGLKVKDIKGKKRFRIRQKKTGKTREVYLAPITEEIEEYTKGMSASDWLFPSRKGNGHITTTQAYRQLVKAGKMLGRDDIGTHTMRKTFGYHHYQKHKDVAILQEIFNHSSPAITKRYIGIRQDEINKSLENFKL